MSDLDNIESIINEYTGNIDIPQVTDENPGKLEQEDANTFVINSIEDLVVFSHNVRSGDKYEGQTVKLGVNLDFKSDKSYVDPYRIDYGIYGYDGKLKQLLTTGEGFIPIGSQDETNCFYGIFDGDNNVICSLYQNINANENVSSGLFSTTYGEIKNLGIVSTNITIKGIVTNIGGITGVSYNNIINSYVTGTINVTGSSWMSIGGLCGNMQKESNIENCYNLANIKCKNILKGYGNADIACGGILGQRNANINKCYNKGNIEADAGDNNIVIGGICGVLRKGSLKNSYNTAKVILSSQNIESSSVNTAGICGIAGIDEIANVINCYNTGKIIGKGLNNVIAGGIVAYQRNNSEIKNLFNVGNIEGESETNYLYIGGILAMEDGANVSNGYNIGMIQEKSNESKLIGSIIGRRFYNYLLDNCYYLKGTYGVGIGEGLSTGVTELDDISKFPSVLEVVNGEGAFKEDANNINNGYPILNWQ